MNIRSLILYFSILNFMYANITDKSTAHAIEENKFLGMTTYNVLAPIWILASDYPEAQRPFLDKVLRREKIIQFLNGISLNTDIIALQEVTETEFKYYQQALQYDYFSFAAYHNPEYWSEYKNPEVTWEANGVALFVKKSSFNQINFTDFALSDDGNHAAYFSGTEKETGIQIRAASVHFDADYNDVDDHYLTREGELKALLELMPQNSQTRDFILGDFNSDSESHEIKPHLLENGFFDALTLLGNSEWTVPDSDGNYKSNTWGRIDHILARNTLPKEAHIRNFGLWKLYPADEEQRVTSNLQLSGSDHFSVSAMFKLY